jgi:hypothetical protein
MNCIAYDANFKLMIIRYKEGVWKQVLKKICGPKKEVTGGWRKVHNEGPHTMYSPNIIRVIKPRRM